MKQRFQHLLAIAGLYLLTFFVGKFAFLAYNSDIETSSLSDAFQVIAHGLNMDLSTTGYLIILPWLVLGVSFWWQRMPVKKVLSAYYIIIGIVLAAIVVGDVVMYGFWKFKLDATVFAYMNDTQGATNSVSIWFIVSRLTLFFITAWIIGYVSVRLAPKALKPAKRIFTLCWLLIGGVIFLFIRGGWQESTMNVGVAYYSPRLFLNHAAVNPAFSLLSSMLKSQDYSKQFQFGNAAEAELITDSLYAPVGADIQDTLLTTRRPNVLLVLMESYGGQYIKELGGTPDVAPNLSQLASEGVFFNNMWANSFRTDRGTVSAFSGWISYPTVSLMRTPGMSDKLPSIAHALSAQGYSTHYLYGGDIKIMGKSGYLVATGYQRLISDKDFSSAEVNESKWGANDKVTVKRTLEEVKKLNAAGKPWHFVLQTLSSHEPYEVPYSRLSNPVHNAFAFTDACIGELVDGLRKQPGWENTLIVLVPDHGSSYQTSYQNPNFFHCPLIWVGGAVREPRTISVLMNQSDLPATLLAQMGISISNFPWSRNVLSKEYTYPFAYCTYPEGIMFKDSTGVSIFDVKAKKPIVESPSASEDRITKAKAILQTSYRRLGRK